MLCEYCGTESAVQAREGLLERPVPIEAEASMPVATQRHSARWTLLILLLPVTCVSGSIGFGIYESVRVNWLGTSQSIVTDVDGDGDADVVGLAQRRGGDAFVVAIDGETGERLWKSDAVGDHSEAIGGLLAVSEGTVLFAGDAGAITAFDGKTGEARWSKPSLGEKVRDACAEEEGAVIFELADRSHRAVALADGTTKTATPSDCAPVWTDDREFPPDLELVEDTHATVGSIRAEHIVRVGPGWVVAGIKDEGSSVPMLAATEDLPRHAFESREPISTRWQTNIPAVDPLEAGAALVAVSEDSAFGAYEMNDRLSRITAIALTDRTRRWDVEIDRHAPLEAVVYAEGHVFVALWGTLLAYSASDGEELYRVGMW